MALLDTGIATTITVSMAKRSQQTREPRTKQTREMAAEGPHEHNKAREGYRRDRVKRNTRGERGGVNGLRGVKEMSERCDK
jgi:hypothetical protein